jgi:hypothetical protein
MKPVTAEELKSTEAGTPARFPQVYSQRVTSYPNPGAITLDIHRVRGEERPDFLTSLATILADGEKPFDVRTSLLKRLDPLHNTLNLDRGEFDAVQAYCGSDHAIKPSKAR